MLSVLLILNMAFAEVDLISTEFKTIDGETRSLNSYTAKAYLVVNIATRCGYTGQLGGLEKLYQKYKDKGLVVIGFPSNDFGGQTPEVEGDVKKFCKLNYGVNFPLTTKCHVKGPKISSFFKKLISLSGEQEISWNFEKFLIDSKGKVIKRYKSSFKPKKINIDIDKLL